MEKLTLTTLRHKLFKVADRVLETGVPVAIERRGKTLLLSAQAPESKLTRLTPRKLVRGASEALVKVKVGAWRERENLK